MGLRSFVPLFQRFFRPYWRSSLAVLALYMVAGFLKGLEPLAFAPLLNAFTTQGAAAPAQRLADLNLNNMAATLIAMFGLGASDKMGIILFGICCYIGLAAAWAALTFVGFQILISVRTSITRDMFVSLHRHILTLPFGYFQRRSAGDFMSRMTHDVEQTSNSLDAVVRGVMQSVAELGLYGYMLFRTDPKLSLIVLALGSAHMAVTKLLSRKAAVRTLRQFDRRSFATHYLLESIQGMRVIKSFSAERYDSGRVSAAAETLRDATMRLRKILFMEVPVRHVVDAAIVCMALLFSFRAMSEGRLHTVGFVLFSGLAVRAIGPVSVLAQQILALHSMMGGAARINAMFATANTMSEGDRKPEPIRDRIVLEHVDFSYRDGTPVLRDINLTIQRGETVAIVGPSGAGKTTLVDLILRFYDPTAGRVTYDGADIRDFSQRSYRRNFGVVPQDPFLFNMTVRENVVFSRKEDAVGVERALRVAHALEFVERLPHVLETVVGDRGTQLSGGQRQRIALARAIYDRPAILVLDEATSSLDSESEHAVQEAVATIIRDMTAIIIAHRLSTVANADRVVVLNDGQIEAVGRHEELVNRSPTYKRLYGLQFPGVSAARGASGNEG